MLKNITYLSFFVCLGLMACKTSDSGAELATAGNKIEYLGCFSVETAKSDVKNSAMNQLVNGAKELCFTESPDSRSGPLTLTILGSNGGLINTLGFSTVTVNRCINCFTFKGFDGSAEWSHERASNPILFDFNARSYGGLIHFELAKKAKN